MSYKEDVRMIKALADENRLRILECLHHDGRWMHYSISEEGKKRFKDMFSHYLETTDSDGGCSCDKCE